MVIKKNDEDHASGDLPPATSENPRDAHDDILDILHRVANDKSNLPRDHAKHLEAAIKTGTVSISGKYSG